MFMFVFGFVAGIGFTFTVAFAILKWENDNMSEMDKIKKREIDDNLYGRMR